MPVIARGQTQFDKAIKYSVDDFNKVLSEEHSGWSSVYSDMKPITFIGNLTGSKQQDLVVVLDSNNYHVGLGMLYVFRFEKEHIKLILVKKEFRIAANIVSWNKHSGLLVAVGKWNDGQTDSTADVLVYDNGKFESVIQFPYSSSIIQRGYSRKSQVISSDSNQIQVIKYENDLKYEDGKPTCTEVSLQTYSWDEQTFKFKSGGNKPLTKNDLDGILLNNKLKFPDDLEGICDFKHSKSSKDQKKYKVPVTADN